MRWTWCGTVVLGALSVAACGGGATDFLGMPPNEAATELANKNCDYFYECGVVEITCDTSPPSGRLVTADQFFGDRAACIGQLQTDYVSLFQGCELADLTDDQIDDVNSCFSQDPGCYSEDAIAELVDGVCNDQPYGSEECQRASQVYAVCLAAGGG